MKSVHELYSHFKQRNFKLTAIDEIAERGNVVDSIYNEYKKLETNYSILQDSNYARDILINEQSDMIKLLRTDLLFSESEKDNLIELLQDIYHCSEIHYKYVFVRLRDTLNKYSN
jgi:hypothetical protein